MKDPRKTGSLAFTISHANNNWHGDANVYNFGPFKADRFTISATKSADRRLMIVVDGPLRRRVAFEEAMPEPTEGAVRIVLTWDKKTATLYLPGGIERAKDFSRLI